jgi:PilZ domain
MNDRRKLSVQTPPLIGERRQEVRRLSKRLDVEFWVETSGEASRYHLAGNVSEGGLFLESPLSLPAGTITQMEMHIPGEPEVLRCAGEVLRAEDGSGAMNVRFTDLGDPERARIETLISGVDVPDPENLG